MSESHKQVSRRFTELFSTEDGSLAAEVLASDVVFHGLPGGDLHGIEAVKEFVAGYRAEFPDARSTVEAQVAEADMVATRWRARARAFDTGGITMERFVDGRIAEVWVFRDELGLLRQLGVIPA